MPSPLGSPVARALKFNKQRYNQDSEEHKVLEEAEKLMLRDYNEV
jgi:hypothetical protein